MKDILDIIKEFSKKLPKFKDGRIDYSKSNEAPVLVELKDKSEIKLDWEHTEFKWIKPEEMKNYDTVTSLDKSLKKVIS